MATMIERTCWCGVKFQARQADVTRGWGRACCKAHAAHAREKKLDRFDFKNGGDRRDFGANSKRLDGIDYEGGGWDAHKGVF